ncbi:MAG: PEP-CTERM sorting domain-containing protein [Methylococcales bacterium]|nr:PEP-CTERM sorting domain-containing protein [Methylococcales bacterium]MBT7445809.1 PEP-CTERM sorting domain-containing protein [Methylococcales bacterium]
MSISFFCKYIIAPALLISSSLSHADIISIDDSVFGDDSITLDTVRALEFLDVTITQGQSIDNVQSQLDGGRFDGFKIATFLQVSTLFNDFTQVAPYPDNSDITQRVFIDHELSDQDVFTNFINTVGNTQQSRAPFSFATVGLIIDPILPDGVVARLAFESRPGILDAVPRTSVFPFFDETTILSDAGVFLVRDALPSANVPEPSTILLFSLGLLGASRKILKCK